MLKLLYFAIFISLTTLLACSGPETSSSPTAVAQAPTSAGPNREVPTPTDAPLETTPEPGMLAST